MLYKPVLESLQLLWIGVDLFWSCMVFERPGDRHRRTVAEPTGRGGQAQRANRHWRKSTAEGSALQGDQMLDEIHRAIEHVGPGDVWTK